VHMLPGLQSSYVWVYCFSPSSYRSQVFNMMRGRQGTIPFSIGVAGKTRIPLGPVGHWPGSDLIVPLTLNIKLLRHIPA